MNAVYGYGGQGGRLTSRYSTTPFRRGLTTARVHYRLRKLITVEKKKYLLQGGPFDGHKMFLTDGTTMKFSVTTMRRVDHDSTRVGPYVPVKWYGCYRCAIVAAGSGRGEAKWVPEVPRD